MEIVFYIYTNSIIRGKTMFSGTGFFKFNFLKVENANETSNIDSYKDTSFNEDFGCENSIFGSGNNKIIGDFFSYEG